MAKPQPPRTPRRPTERQAKVVAGLKAGKSLRQSAREAGYAPRTVEHADRDILPSIEVNFREIIRRHIPAEKIAQRVAEGLDATVVKVASFEGQITDVKTFVDHGERRAHAELAAKLGGYFIPTDRLEVQDEVDPREKLRQFLAKQKAQ